MKSCSASEIADALECYRMKSERQRKNCKNKSCHYNNNDSYYGCYCCSNSILHDAITMMKEQESIIKSLKSDLHETLDVVANQGNVVRCKDCKHWKDQSSSSKWLPCAIMQTEKNWFCADGEKR